MKITSIETIPIKVPIKPEFAIRSGRGGSHVVSPFLLVKVHTDAGITGLGEVSCTPRWSGEDQVSAAHFIKTYLAPLLEGEDPRQIESLTAKFRLGVAGNFFTKSGIEMALWDIAGKAAGKPVYELLGGTVREFIPTKWSVSGQEPDKAADIARWAVAQGFKAMKVKVGIEPDKDVARVAAVRAAIGSQIKLGVDANGGWSREVAASTIERLYASSIYFAEQPIPPEDLLYLPELRKQLKVPIIADESIYSLQDAMTLAHLQAADVFSIYVGKAGGIGPARKIAQFAESVGLKCTVGSNLELGIGSAAMIHLAIATHAIDAESYPCDIIGPMFYEDDMLVEPLPIVAGKAQPNSKPGLGVELNEKTVEKYRVC
ncbi:mandelate racemase/muconate lactonizing enzyme family protein [Pedosphaera parvula]|uniref:Mandelate racemase/muconate lactonizing protein n=1 Tax=Pedosphaera parvula (strain Ellin514) TaxID=320771 RepID=B9XFT7_PEDPL|nr:enolase C-terminal domain-like protein [Pedosphaera parvula]EEF61451.1 Mandelate racemase/muconate lactonizing protein [Pedosphaera parvula Ellin514]